jgi:malonyl-CoA decarboxylase
MARESRSEPSGSASSAGLIDKMMRLVGRANAPDLAELAEALLSERGEASGVALAGELLAAYGSRRMDERIDFLLKLASRFDADRARLERAIDRYRNDPSTANGVALHAAAEPRRQELIRRLNLAPGGTERLVRMREDVLDAAVVHPELETVDADFQHLFSSWFNRGFLELKRIDWNTPAVVLERIIRYEAVHEITSWDDLRRRIDPEDRRCFAFFHPALAGEPLIFVEVALAREIPAAIAPLLAAERRAIAAQRATTAVFYSISNCQEGLRGVPLGNFLIKQVVDELKRELPDLRTFVTLSPVPGFVGWLRRERTASTATWLSDDDRRTLAEIDESGWQETAVKTRALRPLLTASLAEYLLRARGRGGRPVDPVARFHLNNGARLERLNWLGDVSAKGLAQGAGFMVNYLYDVGQIERNHEAFAREGRVIAARAVQKALRPQAAAA